MRFVTAPDGTRLQYDDQGEGLPVLCLPGLTRNMDDFLPVLEEFGDSARIIRMDFRGRGGSDHAPYETYSVPQEAADVVVLLDHLGIDRAAILGTSRGGLVAMMMAVTFKTRLQGVFLNDVGPEIMPEGLDLIMHYIGVGPSFESFEHAERAVAKTPGFTGVTPAQWAAHVRALYAEGPEGGLQLRYDPKLRDAVAPAFDTSVPAPDLWPLFDGFEGVPLALLRGAASNILSEETTAEMRRRRPDMLFAELPDRGHVPFLDEPVAVALIADWMAACA